MSDSLVPVEVGACRCVGTPHPDGDIVFLASHLSLRGGFVAERTMIALSGAGKDRLEVEAGLIEVYVRFGVSAWNLLDAEGDPIPVNEDTIRSEILSDFARARPLADAADGLYTSAILDPLVARLSKSSRATQTRGSTSATPPSSSSPPKRSKPSSTTTSATALRSV